MIADQNDSAQVTWLSATAAGVYVRGSGGSYDLVATNFETTWSHAEANFARVPERQHHRRRYTLSTAGATTQIVGSPTPPQKS
jgi:outer membrane scaffolding protein for murein synthesis (MipA/OmpV family)